MAGESTCVLVWLLALHRHISSPDDQRLARSYVAGLAAIHDVGVGYVDLLNLGIVVLSLLDQALNLAGLKLDGIIGEVFRNFVLSFADWFKHVSQLSAQLGALIFKIVVGFLQSGEIVIFPAPIRILHCERAFFVLL